MKKYPFLLIIILIALVFAAGCNDEMPAAPPPPQTGVVMPGQVLYSIGAVTGSGQLGGHLVSGTIDSITFTVGLVPGEKEVDMEKITIVYADAIRTEMLVPVKGFRGDPPDGAWGILEVRDELGEKNNRLEFEEKFVIRINPKAPLVPRQLITISVKAPSGTPLTIRRISPSTIMAENNILAPI